MSHELFSGTLTVTSPDTEMTAGPQAEHVFEIASLYIMNGAVASATVTVYKDIDGFEVEVYSGSIAAGEAYEITDVRLFHGQSIYISANQLVSYSAFGTVSNPHPRVPENDITFNCLTGSYDGVLILELEISGDLLFTTAVLDDFTLAVDLEISGVGNMGVTFDSSDDSHELEATFYLDLEIDGEAVVCGPKGNWIGWSKIGEASFRADMVNDAGFMQMPWAGWVYAVKQLGKNVVVYGSGGVAVIYPASQPVATYGFQKISQVGVTCKTAIAGDHAIHYFIDVKGRLWNVTSEGAKKLGYEEFLASMTNPVLSFDYVNRWLYISDVNVGYVLTEVGMGGGWNNLTGVEIVDGDLLGVVNDDRDMLYPEIQTGPLDFGYRGMKTIDKLLFGVVTEKDAVAAVDYKYDKDTHYRTSGWTPVNKEGVAHIRAAGTDFRIRFKLMTPGFCELSYINVQFKKSDHRFDRSYRRINYGDGGAAAYRDR